ncbi:MAG: DUF4331 domain-containing protein [Acidimicrobiales bacterium]
MTARDTRSRGFRPPGKRALIGLGLGAALTASMLGNAGASSHREAPLIADDPTADNTDLYAFVAPDAAGSVTLISNWSGFQEPGGGPNYFSFGDDVLHKIYIDNDGDAVEDITYEFKFTTLLNNPDNYLYADGVISSPQDGDWSMPQEYSVTRVQDGARTVLAEGLRTAPNNVGPNTTPDYDAIANQAIHPLGAGKVFAGQRAEGFYADIAGIFDGLNVRPLSNLAGIDTFAGYNVLSIALQVPKADLVAVDDVVGIWTTSERQKVRVFNANSGAQPINTGRWVQVSRLGNPLVNEVVVPLKVKDVFNTLRPQQDLDVFPTLSAPGTGSTDGDIPLVTDPILANQLQAVDPAIPSGDRQDLVAIFLTGLDGLNKQENVRPSEILRLNTAIPPTAFADQNRLGVLEGDNAGFPNGRRPIDDVVDIAIQAVAGETADPARPNDLGDGVNGPDKPFLNAFPYLASPYSGFDDINNELRVTDNPGGE